MSSLQLSIEPRDNGQEDKSKNGEQVVTVFDLATEIEQSLKTAIKDIQANDKEFKQQYELIEKKLKDLEK
ncbi:LAQU0S02e01200g1_1 [Lachancea quebecensis]|uniref:LAQU0S02e01200g1_1 n=1 Tax=Lachancea quebecensis TaxID=1654605 RepID=A0A0N7ML02_9SACH|nr:LAQU0S02e01200g1_1 [Lachancea quebecensis]